VKKTILLLIIIGTICSCINPFAPARMDADAGFVIGDQTTISGFFQSFSYAYNMRDTVVYGKLLADDFIFTYMNYKEGMVFSWTRDEDMRATYRLFNAAQNFDFV